MADPSELSALVAVRVGPYPASGMAAGGATPAGMFDLPGFISGNVAGPTFTQVNDTSQDSPGQFKEYFPGYGEPINLDLTLKFNAQTLAVLVGCIAKAPGAPLGTAPAPTNSPFLPHRGRFLWEGSTPSGIRYRTIGYMNWSKLMDIPDDDRLTTSITVQGSGPPVIMVPLASTLAIVQPTLPANSGLPTATQ